MSADLTREQAREQVARAIRRKRADVMTWGGFGDSDTGLALAALDVLWPVVEGLRAELAHAHTVIARHVEPKRSTGSWDHKWPGAEDGNTPSDALCGDLTDFPCCPGGGGRVDETGGSE